MAVGIKNDEKQHFWILKNVKNVKNLNIFNKIFSSKIWYFGIAGLTVVANDNQFFDNKNELSNINNAIKDIRDIEISDLHDVDYVIHLSELSNDPLGEVNEDLTYSINHASVQWSAWKPSWIRYMLHL